MIYTIEEIENKKIWGRCGLSDGNLVLFWTESGVEFNVKAGFMEVEIDAAYQMFELWLDVFIDDERVMRFPLREGKHKYQVLRGFDKTKETRVRIVRNTQSMPDDKVSLIKICSVDTDAEFLPVKDRAYRFEFIGDSITSGEGGAALTREEWIPTVFDPAVGYAAKTAKILDAEYSIVSQSGWGLYASWDGNIQGAIPVVYPFVCGSQKSEEAIRAGAGESWDYDSHRNDAVIINLGTNDSGAMKLDKWARDEFIKLFHDCGKAFLNEVRKENKDAVIVWAYGMLGNEIQSDIMDVVNEYNEENGDNVHFLLLPDCNDGHVGARMHPDPDGHKLAADTLSEFLKMHL